MSGTGSYLRATRHPWACLWFMLPLLLAYEIGVLCLSSAGAGSPRTGADTWVRWSFQKAGLDPAFWPPLIIIAVFVVWNWVRRGDRPGDAVGTWLGMAVESVAFALLLWGVWQVQTAVLAYGNGLLATPSPEQHRRLASAISFFGAGIYEEFLFRLLLFPVMHWFLRFTDVGPWTALVAAMFLSAIIFSAAHHIGPHGEEIRPAIFLFRTLAGIYFAALYYYRGFGVAAGTHACYDVLVGVAMA